MEDTNNSGEIQQNAVKNRSLITAWHFTENFSFLIWVSFCSFSMLFQANICSDIYIWIAAQAPNISVVSMGDQNAL